MERTPVTAATARFTFYDLESLSDAFTLCAYTPESEQSVDTLEVFFLVDDPVLAASVAPRALYDRIMTANPGLPAVNVKLWNLNSEPANYRLATLIGLSNAENVCDRGELSDYPSELRPVCDTDPSYDPVQHPFLAGYNSLNYDSVMLALYFTEVFPAPHRANMFQPATAGRMRQYNDQLFGEQHIGYMPGYLGWDSPAARIRRSMLGSGRHLDVARLNEVQFKVSLKRLLGILGRQIKESDRLGQDGAITSPDDLYDLLAYNVSDCLGLAQLFRHPAYAGSFDLKAGLLAQYSETVLHQNGTVRRDRLTIDSSSAKFVGRILAPFTPLTDIEAVSFMYPDPVIARERGVQTVNVLDECVRFFEQNVAPDPGTVSGVSPAQVRAHRQFMQVVDYYRSIEGQNFNDSDEYRQMFTLPARSLRDIPKAPNNIPYFQADGSPSSCFVTFSTGGIHGAEADLSVYTAVRIEHLEHEVMLRRAKLCFPDANDFLAEARHQHNRLTLPDGSTVDKRLVLLGSSPEKVKFRKPKKDDPIQAAQVARAQAAVPDAAMLLATQRPATESLNVLLPDGTVLEGKVVLANTSVSGAAYRAGPVKTAPALFTGGDNEATKLHPKFARTSAGLAVHEDFTSYYPNLLRNMRAFYNPELGEDRYAKIFFDKERYGREMKRPGLSPEEKTRLETLRNGTKLILNSASGAGDARHRTPIRMNNRIISMRIIGQLFSWRIGQAQTLAGARIISTNTDGLYSVVDHGTGFDEVANNRVLAEQQHAIGIDIEPELMFLISKDSNNRLELAAPARGKTVAESAIVTASGGTLACHSGPTPTKSLAHPAVVDFALARYLQTIASGGEAAFAEPFDHALGLKMIQEAVRPDAPVRTLLLFQNVIAASRGSITYPFAAEPIGHTPGDDQDTDATLAEPRALQMVNRVFVVQAGTPGAVSLHNAGAWKVTSASQAKRRDSGSSGVRRDPLALRVLRHHGWARNRAEASVSKGLMVLPDDQDVVIRRINGLDPTWPMAIVNDDLYSLPSTTVGTLIASLDLDIYNQMLADTFTKNWMNTAV
ncbi:hypothetical protein [Amycolatopsis sp. TNS106]|uniref:hypothetical protein n=1 Tax=Amycolatopsis sp. TNS106 TaxID=2861750 RepID=UPI001C581950|nr:hypothetical protein [Amycolatopsis sp. TNS106]